MQPQIGIATMSVALAAVLVAWMIAAPAWSGTWQDGGMVALIPCLVGTVILAYRFPVYIRHNTKICVFTVPLYLIAVLLPPPIAATAAGLGILGGEVSVQTRHANSLWDIATHTGRWMLVVLLGSLLSQGAGPATTIPLHSVLLVGAALVLFAGDLLTLPLALGPICDERIDRILLTCIRQGGLVEAAQYGLGILGALVVEERAWAAVLLVLPTGLLYLLFKKDVDPDTYQLLESMADAVDLRDPYTVDHSRRVLGLTGKLLEELGRNGQEAALILMAARLHDVGKVGVPDHILVKRDGLTGEERGVMETHAERGGKLLAQYPDFARVLEMVRHHHERWDGTGYPDGLEGTDIPFGARIIAVAESFDAMTSDRSYRRALSTERAAEVLTDGRNRQWDPMVVDAFLQSLAGQLDRPIEPASAWALLDGSDMNGAAVAP
jgi:HD-GYP domain-containing protein (c-di-GMP phosphodiesterase class II)